jgi:hypothetical protein
MIGVIFNRMCERVFSPSDYFGSDSYTLRDAVVTSLSLRARRSRAVDT